MFFLIEHNRTTKITTVQEYGDYSRAQQDCLSKEQEYYRDNRDEMEVVIFEADSIDDLRRTHSRYFVDPNFDNQKKKEDESGALLAAGLIGLALYLLK